MEVCGRLGDWIGKNTVHRIELELNGEERNRDERYPEPSDRGFYIKQVRQ
jgi:hypothetical protein